MCTTLIYIHMVLANPTYLLICDYLSHAVNDMSECECNKHPALIDV